MSKTRLTSDKLIRSALKKQLELKFRKDPNAKIIEELGISHGAARVDIAVVNGVLHGYELKSDIDTLLRLPEQIKYYNSVFDQVTLVVGKNHLHEAIKLVPEWWGVKIAKYANRKVIFQTIRESENNDKKNSVSIAKLLWRDEALELLQEVGCARGFRNKPRLEIYKQLANVVKQEDLALRVRDRLFSRPAWRY